MEWPPQGVGRITNSLSSLGLKTLTAVRYLTPLKEGGSLPAVVDTAENGTWVVKFRGAGQGPKALVAEIIVGLMALELGLPVPEIALVDIDPAFGRTEKDPEIQDILTNSHGLNVGLRYLEGAFNFDPTAAQDLVPNSLATRVVWLDALALNPDRTHRNPNILVSDRRPFLIDHGAALYFHHDWARMDPGKARAPFVSVSEHVLLRHAEALEETDSELADQLDVAKLSAIADMVPEELLSSSEGTAAALRTRYVEFLSSRLQEPRTWVSHAAEAHRAALISQPERFEARR